MFEGYSVLGYCAECCTGIENWFLRTYPDSANANGIEQEKNQNAALNNLLENGPTNSDAEVDEDEDD